MDVAGVSGSVVQNNLASPLARTNNVSGQDDKATVSESRTVARSADEQLRALDVLRQELRLALKQKFYARYPTQAGGYSQPGNNSASIKDETLGAARQLVSQAPGEAGELISAFRAQVRETASFVNNLLGGRSAPVESTVNDVNSGLNDIENEVAANQTATTTALAIDSRSKQRSTIRIQTQEGDIVRFELKQVDKVSATDASSSDENSSTSVTEVSVSSRSRIVVNVEGDLNEAEFEAIQNVFAQAEEIANEFFDGDLAAAFDLSQGFEFDSEQLAQVKLRFQVKETINVGYAASGPVPAADTPAIDAPTEGSVVTPTLPTANPIATDTGDAAAVPTADAAEAPVDDASTTVLPTSLSQFFDLVTNFLQNVSDGFQNEENGASLHFSQSFKLNLLSAVINVSAPDEATDAAATATNLIDAISGTATVDPASVAEEQSVLA